MRTLMIARLPVQRGNAAINDGSLERTIQNTLSALQPEAAYFFPYQGRRTAFIVFDLKDSSQIPSVGEPLFQALEAEVELMPVMSAEDLQKGLAAAAAGARAHER